MLREALRELKKEDGTLHAENVLKMLEEVNRPQKKLVVTTAKSFSFVRMTECRALERKRFTR